MPKRGYIAIIYLFLLSCSTLVYSVGATSEQKQLSRDTFSILIDEGHGPLFGYNELRDALEYLNNTITVKIYVNTGEIDRTKLTGIDLIIIPPPNTSATYTQQERLALKEYVTYGGAVLMLGIPLLSSGENMNPLEFNAIIRAVFDGVPFAYYDRDVSADIVYDDVHSSGEILNISRETVLTNMTELFENVTNIYLRSASIKISDKAKTKSIYLKTSAYSVSKNGIINYNNETVSVLASKEISGGILTVIGFGEAFTNKISPLGARWIDLGDNKQFFKNTILWMLRLDRWLAEDIRPAQDIYIYFVIASSISLCIYYLAFKKEQKEKALKAKAKETIKASEIIKKIREKKEK